MSKYLTYSPANALDRPIIDGSEYDSCFGKTDNKRTMFRKNLSTRDTVLAMIDIINSKNYQTKDISVFLDKGSLLDTCQNIWNFCYNYLKYQRDIEEELREPNATWRDGQILARQYPKAIREDGVQYGVDCDCYSIFIGSILCNLDIPFNIKMTSYLDNLGFDNGFQHVYIIVPSGERTYITIDPVVHAFNYEKPFSKYELFTLSKKIHTNMAKVYVLSGVAEETTSYDNSLVDLITGKSLLGNDSAEDLDILNYLKSTRDAVLSKQISVINQNPNDFITMLDLAIKHWNNPENREIVLEQLSQIEDYLVKNDNLKLRGFDLGISELSGFFKDLKEKNKEKKSTQSKGTLLNKLNKANPVTLTVRNSFRALIGINFLGLASIMASDDVKAKEFRTKVDNLYFSLGGKKDTLDKTIEKGKTRKPIFNKDQKADVDTSDLGWLGEPVTIATITTAAAVPLATTVKWAKDAGIFKDETASKAMSAITSTSSAKDSKTTETTEKTKTGLFKKLKEKKEAKKEAAKKVVETGMFDEKDINKDGKVSLIEKLANKSKTTTDTTTNTTTDVTNTDTPEGKTENQIDNFKTDSELPDNDETSIINTLGKLIKEHPIGFAFGTTVVVGSVAFAFPQVREWAGLSSVSKKIGEIPLS